MTLSVSEITRLIKEELEDNFSSISIEGEISNLKKHVSGHWYFNLKDSNAMISCTMWKGFNNYVFFTPEDGMKIVANGRITVYPPRGSYQLEVRSMKPAGVGELQAAFERLKAKLQAEGIFDDEFKKPIPVFPKKIGIVTAIDGAALRDMVSIAQRRYPLVELMVYPARVQGEGSAKSIVEGIEYLNERDDIDLIIIGRGGGSLEDLWAFNEEIVARAVFASCIPVISAVGHEVDFTISDFAADLRAATPSAAMEVATPNKDDFFAFLEEFSFRTSENIFYIIDRKKREVASHLKAYGFRVPQDLVRIRSQQLDNTLYRLQQKIDGRLLSLGNRLSLNEKGLESHDVNRILKKGFVLVKQGSKLVVRGEDFRMDEPAELKFHDKEIWVNKKSYEEKK
ncbi:MAG TPA: exodeoxyribonuclease VII large subunit [Ignavibacteriales bacterium]|nr:exodeoxyribonuclease VII large subunit [Ignavibacteriales bacterium]